MVFLMLLSALVAWGIPVLAVIFLLRQRRRLRQLGERVDKLERALAQGGAPARSPETQPAKLPAARPAAPVAPAAAAALPPLPRMAPSTAPSGPKLLRVEEWIGGVGLQNVGSVLLLLGVLFLLLWGYGTGRIGPQFLVIAGVALGAVVAWRGDRLVPSLPGFGYALVGIGLGTAYLTLCLGHFRLDVLSRELATALLALTSAVTVLLGIRYRAQYFAIVGVAGAHLPPLLGAWLPMSGFFFPAPELVGYLAAVNLAVYALAWRSGWSALSLAAVLLTTGTWLTCAAEIGWGWRTETALSLLFVGLGLSPLPAIRRRAVAPHPVDLGVVATAPLGLALCSWPFLADQSRFAVAAWAVALFVLYAGAARWIGRRDAESDLWKIATAAATLFLTIAVANAFGHRSLSLAWAAEGVVLVYFGLRARSPWLRVMGYAVETVAALSFLSGLFSTEAMERIRTPLASFTGLRDLATAIVLLTGGRLLSRTRELLTRRERRVPEIWLGVGNLFLALWIGREAGHLASNWVSGGVAGYSPTARFALSAALTGFGWMVQSAVLLALSRRGESRFLRWLGHAAGVFACWTVLFSLFERGTWREGGWPVLHPSGLFTLVAILLATAATAYLRANRSILTGAERRAPEAWAATASVLWMAWTAREAGNLARALVADPEAYARVATFSAAFTSGAWLVQSVALMALGWFRGSAFLRWSGLALLAITVAKFLFYDLRTVDLFWRFLTAAIVGAALLAISYAYQRKRRRAGGMPG